MEEIGGMRRTRETAHLTFCEDFLFVRRQTVRDYREGRGVSQDVQGRAASLRPAWGSGHAGAMRIPVHVASAPRSENLAPTDLIVEWQLDPER